MILGPPFLVGSAVTAALASWAAAHLVSGAQARRARAALGEPLDRVPEGGGAVTLRGRLQVREQPCPRFADAAPAAATTAAMGGGAELPTDVSARAGGLVLHVGDTAVELEGPLRVVAGSHEKTVGGKVAATIVRGGLLKRISEVDPEVAWSLWSRPRRVRLRALADGDRVRVAGRLQRTEGPLPGASSYRVAGAPWCLVPDAPASGEPAALSAAYEGVPGGPQVARSLVAGIVGGALGLALAVLLLPPLPPPVGNAGGMAEDEARLESLRDQRFDGLERALEEGDFAAASAAMPAHSGFERYEAEVHILAGRFEKAASLLPAETMWRAGADVGDACLVQALLAHAGGEGAAVAGARLRDLAGGRGEIPGRGPLLERSPEWRTQRIVCSLLLADLLPPTGERLAVLDAMPPVRFGGFARVRALLELEAGGAPAEIFAGSDALPAPYPLLHRSPHAFSEALLGVPIAAATRSGSGLVDRAFRGKEAARAAYVLSAVGDHEGARQAFEQARRHVGFIDPVELSALHVALEVRAGAISKADALAGQELPADHELAPLPGLLVHGPRNPEAFRDSSEARQLDDALRRAADVPAIVAELNKVGTSSDGEWLFLLGPYLGPQRDGLLAWVKTGNRRRDRHDGKGPRAPYPPIDFLARLEERRSLAASLGDAALASELGGKLQRGRDTLLRREVAVLVYLLRHFAY
jgi:hypothetical protein